MRKKNFNAKKNADEQFWYPSLEDDTHGDAQRNILVHIAVDFPRVKAFGNYEELDTSKNDKFSYGFDQLYSIFFHNYVDQKTPPTIKLEEHSSGKSILHIIPYGVDEKHRSTLSVLLSKLEALVYQIMLDEFNAPDKTLELTATVQKDEHYQHFKHNNQLVEFCQIYCRKTNRNWGVIIEQANKGERQELMYLLGIIKGNFKTLGKKLGPLFLKSLSPYVHGQIVNERKPVFYINNSGRKSTFSLKERIKEEICKTTDLDKVEEHALFKIHETFSNNFNSPNLAKPLKDNINDIEARFRDYYVEQEEYNYGDLIKLQPGRYLSPHYSQRTEKSLLHNQEESSSIVMYCIVGESEGVVLTAAWRIARKFKIGGVIKVLTTNGDLAQKVSDHIENDIASLNDLLVKQGLEANAWSFEHLHDIEIARTLNGEEFVDITSDSHRTEFAELMYKRIKELTSQRQAPLYCVMSGGRKTMSMDMALVMSLLGREQDRLFHVITDTERDLEVDDFDDYEHQISLIDYPYLPFRQIHQEEQPNSLTKTIRMTQKILRTKNAGFKIIKSHLEFLTEEENAGDGILTLSVSIGQRRESTNEIKVRFSKARNSMHLVILWYIADSIQRNSEFLICPGVPEQYFVFPRTKNRNSHYMLNDFGGVLF